jgi:hypothetical protein
LLLVLQSGRDAEMRAVEEGYREAFLVEPAAMVDAWRQGELLLDVFHPDVLPSFVYEVGAGARGSAAAGCVRR